MYVCSWATGEQNTQVQYGWPGAGQMEASVGFLVPNVHSQYPHSAGYTHTDMHTGHRGFARTDTHTEQLHTQRKSRKKGLWLSATVVPTEDRTLLSQYNHHMQLQRTLADSC